MTFSRVLLFSFELLFWFLWLEAIFYFSFQQQFSKKSVNWIHFTEMQLKTSQFNYKTRKYEQFLNSWNLHKLFFPSIRQNPSHFVPEVFMTTAEQFTATFKTVSYITANKSAWNLVLISHQINKAFQSTHTGAFKDAIKH